MPQPAEQKSNGLAGGIKTETQDCRRCETSTPKTGVVVERWNRV